MPENALGHRPASWTPAARLLITLPVGMNLFVLRGVSPPDVTLAGLTR